MDDDRPAKLTVAERLALIEIQLDDLVVRSEQQLQDLRRIRTALQFDLRRPLD